MGEVVDDGEVEVGDEEAVVSSAHIPIPTETFLEELSVKMELHPISVFWLLEELRAEGARYRPEERRLLEDRLSVLALRLLGHRWPKQIEAGEPVPEWADRDGIIPLGEAAPGEATMAERLRARLRADDGDIGAQRTEALLVELTGAQSLDDWLARTFWPRHVRQFKARPVAWHLTSRPAGAKGKGKSGRRAPLFECMLYYHATGGDALARLRTQYVEPLLRREDASLARARDAGDLETAACVNERVEELNDFLRRIEHVEREGFACAELDALLAREPLDRWSGNGIVAPPDTTGLLRQERAWRVDLNDGVRVNIALIQQAGLLAADVLKTVDAKKASADRARWRADERRWVREGKLPRCGWMPESVPESPEWTRKAPERAAEQRKLEEKRRAVVERGRSLMTDRHHNLAALKTWLASYDYHGLLSEDDVEKRFVLPLFQHLGYPDTHGHGKYPVRVGLEGRKGRNMEADHVYFIVAQVVKTQFWSVIRKMLHSYAHKILDTRLLPGSHLPGTLRLM